MLSRPDSPRATTSTEPCRVLVMLDFPVNVTGVTSRLLSTTMQKGSAFGVHAIMLVDTDHPTPYGFNLHELEQVSTTVAWDGRRFIWQDPDFKSCWIELDKPPRGQLAKRILRGVQQPTSRTA